ncbi:MAG: hypothetical protein KBC21_01025 [Candidatus Pacebacteria bacterium]|nr:hypothetical protein [Candidatus Paceibacterota bacterium]
MKKISPLSSLGLSNEEITVYEALLKKQPMSPTEICSTTSLYRPSVYEAIEKLKEKDLVSTVPFGKRSKYTPNSPKRLKELSSLQGSRIQEEIIRLEELQIEKSFIPKVTIRQGQQAIRMLYEELVSELKKGDIYYRYHAIDTDNWTSGKYVTQRARQIRDAKELERYVITNEANKKRKASRLNRHIKVLPQKHDLFTHNVGQVMYGNTTVIIDYNNEVATVIESEAIMLFQKALFKTLFHYL